MTEVLSPGATGAIAGLRPAVRNGHQVVPRVNGNGTAIRVPPLRAPRRSEHLAEMTAQALELGLRRVHVLAWRDFDDPEAGGSETFVHRVGALWAESGLEVTLRSSEAPGLESVTNRSGYRVVRKSGRYAVFPRTMLSGFLGRRGRPDGLVEVWNGMPFFSPLWARCPKVVVIHAVHAEMWRMVLTPKLAKIGETIELRLAPPLYRRSRIVTISPSSRDELISTMGFDPSQVSLALCGLDEQFSPSGRRSRSPLVVAVGRLVPVKRFDLLVDMLADAKRFVPDLRAEIIGEGYERPVIEAKIKEHGAESWIELKGRVSDEELVDAYRRAWVVASASAREGWNLTLSEAAACGTPAVATAVVGQQDSVCHEVTGLLAEPGRDFTAALVRVLTDSVLRERLSNAALKRAQDLTWEATAADLLEALVDEARAKR